MPKRVEIGVVTTDKMAQDPPGGDSRGWCGMPKYGKILHRKTVCHVHDESNESHLRRHGRDRRVRARAPRPSGGNWCGW